MPLIWYAWTGREYDEETGWYYHRARYYSPLIRRFVQEDPIGYDGGTNLYAYVEGQPLEATDPTGTRMCEFPRCGGSYGSGAPAHYVALDGRMGAGTGGGGSGFGSSDLEAIFGSGAGHQARASRALSRLTFTVTLTDGRSTETIVFKGDTPATDRCTLCKGLPGGFASYQGLAGDLFPVLGAPGGTGVYGVYVDNKGGGGFVRLGLGSGFDISLGIATGYSTNFRGFSAGGQLGKGSGATGAGVSFGWKGISGSGGEGVIGAGRPGIQGNGAVTYTRAWQTQAWK